MKFRPVFPTSGWVWDYNSQNPLGSRAMGNILDSPLHLPKTKKKKTKGKKTDLK